jgi:Small-conductance mechanosensitive channel
MEQASDAVVATRAALAQLMALAVQYSFSIIGALVLLTVGWIASRMLSQWAFKGVSRIHGIDVTLAHFFAQVVRYGVLVLVVVMVLGQFGVQTASILAALGAIGLAIGLALQGTLQNIAAGIMLLVLRPFRVGEAIETNDINGTIIDIGLFATELRTYDGLYRLAPNSTLWNVPVTNYSRLPTRMHDFKVGIAYEDDIDKALHIMLDLVNSDSRVLKDPAPTAYVDSLGDSSVNLTLRYWARSDVWWNTTRDVTKGVKEAFDAQNITIPYPQVTYRAPSDEQEPPLLNMPDAAPPTRN